MKQKHKPGDQIINRYMPDCSDDDREIARERLQGLAKLLLRVAMRLAREEAAAKTQEQKDAHNVSIFL